MIGYCFQSRDFLLVKVVRKIHHRIGHECLEGYIYNATLSLSSALDELGGKRHGLTALPPEKYRFPLHKELSCSQGRSGRMSKITPQAAFDLRTVLPVESSCNNYAFPVQVCR